MSRNKGQVTEIMEDKYDDKFKKIKVKVEIMRIMLIEHAKKIKYFPKLFFYCSLPKRIS